MSTTDQPQQHGVGGVVSNCRECGEALEASDTWFHDVCTDADKTIQRLEAQIAQLAEERDRLVLRSLARFAALNDMGNERDDLRARCASLEAVVEAAKRIALRQSPAHQALRQALAALNATQEGTHG
jgi:chromosome segregation ATPase